jgi:hypothetical protein
MNPVNPMRSGKSGSQSSMMKKPTMPKFGVGGSKKAKMPNFSSTGRSSNSLTGGIAKPPKRY